MSVCTTAQQRRLFAQLHDRGLTYLELASMHGVSKECVRYWCRRQRGGQSVERSRRPRGHRLLERFDPRVRYVVVRLRLEHPRWGPGVLRYHLGKRSSLQGLALPSLASIGRYLHQWKRFRRRSSRKPPAEPYNPPTYVHQRWKMDFKEGIALVDGSQVNLATIWEPVGEACVGAELFPAGLAGKKARRVSLEDAWRLLYSSMATWQTQPEEVQTDGEPTLVAQKGAFPSLFTLRLAGLGIRHRVVHRATLQAEVERGHRTLNEYALVGNEHLPIQALRIHLKIARHELVFELPSQAEGCAGRPPIQAHPELLQPRHAFQPEHLEAQFCLASVDAFLAGLHWERIVNRSGQVRLGWKSQRYSLGKAWAGQKVSIHFDPHDRCFVFSVQKIPEQEITRLPAKRLSATDILGVAQNLEGLVPQQLPLPFFQGVNC